MANTFSNLNRLINAKNAKTGKSKTKPLKVRPTIAICVMCALMLGGIFLGNRNAVIDSSREILSRVEVIRQKVDTMAGKANNFVIIGERVEIDEKRIDELKTAISNAKELTARDMSSIGTDAPNQLVKASSELKEAVLWVDKEIRNSGKEEMAIQVANNGWTNEVLTYEDIVKYNTTVAANTRGGFIPFKFLLGGYNYRPILD